MKTSFGKDGDGEDRRVPHVEFFIRAHLVIVSPDDGSFAVKRIKKILTSTIESRMISTARPD